MVKNEGINKTTFLACDALVHVQGEDQYLYIYKHLFKFNMNQCKHIRINIILLNTLLLLLFYFPA